ncbi:MAG: serine/threonine protein kinase, partial [Bacteroidota bacterium]|nr:serine/threonine protein kinase [Bacteroidota bacterium]
MSKLFTIAENLENMGAIKTGGQGSVYKGRRIGEMITAIKLLPTPIFSQDEDDKHYRDFINEVQKLKRVGEEPNPNIVRILSSGISETGSFPYIEMEFIDGPDLGELLKPPHSPVFTIKDLIKVADQLSNALAHCHKLDVKHGDIKSNNVKYNQHTGNYVLLDFGLAILSDEERRTSLRHAGAIEFMAPEQNEGKMFFETDVYSFGIILYELLAGKVPFPLDGNSETARNKVMIAHMEMAPPDALELRRENLSQDWTEEQKAWEMQVPEWITACIYKCLQKKREDRYANGIELHEFISHHRIHTAEVIGLVKDEDQKWKTVLTDKERELKAKDEELEDLKAIVLKQDSELQNMKTGKPPSFAAVDYNKSKKVSRGAFTAVLIIAIIAGCFAAYSLFFNKSAVGALQTDENRYAGDSAILKENVDEAKHLENISTAKKLSSKERKKQVADSLFTIKQMAKTSEPKLQVTETGNSNVEEEAKALDQTNT